MLSLTRVCVVGLLLMSCKQRAGDTQLDAPPVVSASAPFAVPSGSIAAPVASIAAPVASIAAPVARDAGAALDSAIQEADDLLAKVRANPAAFDGKVLTVRGRFANSGKEAGFSLVDFVDMSTDATKSVAGKAKHTCQGEFSPGEDGDSYPRNTVILLTGTVSASATRPSNSLYLTDCTTKRAR
jgi:hypothetical protein